MRRRSYTSNSNIIKAAAGLCLFIACIAVFLVKIGEEYKKATENNVINAFTAKRFEDFYALPENSLDMVFVGSSHSYCTFDPENFDTKAGISSFQMGTPLQHMDTSYYELLEILKYQKPSIVVLEAYWDVLGSDFDMKQADTFFEVLKDNEVKEKYFEEAFPINEKIKYKLPGIRYQQDYFEYMSSRHTKWLEDKLGVYQEKAKQQNGTEYYRSKGYVYCDHNMLESEFNETNQFKGLDGEKYFVSERGREYLQKIIELCSNEGIKLVMVTAPVANVSLEYIKNYDMIYEKISEIAEENEIPYIDYNIISMETGFLTNDNFRDDAHLNDSGVKLVDAHFLDWLYDMLIIDVQN